MPLIHSFPPSAEALNDACAALKQGRLIALATETVFGVAADASNPEAIAALYAAKGRAAGVPLQILVPDFATAEKIGVFNETAHNLADRFWPGALTLVVPLREDARTWLASNLMADDDTIGIRVPDHPTAQALLRAYAAPIAASSANKSGETAAQNANQARKALPSVALILDGACDPKGVASSVIGCLNEKIHIIRAGVHSEDILNTHG